METLSSHPIPLPQNHSGHRELEVSHLHDWVVLHILILVVTVTLTLARRSISQKARQSVSWHGSADRTSCTLYITIPWEDHGNSLSGKSIIRTGHLTAHPSIHPSSLAHQHHLAHHSRILPAMWQSIHYPNDNWSGYTIYIIL